MMICTEVGGVLDGLSLALDVATLANARNALRMAELLLDADGLTTGEAAECARRLAGTLHNVLDVVAARLDM
ncbi:hypothetical protein ACFQLX_20785 [Streptomyces polyrhachis]|uniref:ANTAR domain-containing protein n=1 Tax=Streptomyces polyrhachis TaxID=1282885 RepID=A0ABW2GLQ0_9ACTN